MTTKVAFHAIEGTLDPRFAGAPDIRTKFRHYDFKRCTLTDAEADMLEDHFRMADVYLKSDIKHSIFTNTNENMKYQLEGKLTSLTMRREAIMTEFHMLMNADDAMDESLSSEKDPPRGGHPTGPGE